MNLLLIKVNRECKIEIQNAEDRLVLFIKDLDVSVKNVQILYKIKLNVHPGQTHVIMGPNGSGKSTLSSIISGQPEYIVQHGTIIFKKLNLLSLTPEERAGEGIFIAFQYPIDIPGVNNQLFLYSAVNSVRKYRKQPAIDRSKFLDSVRKKMNLLKMPEELLTRSVNFGFSGGEKKRNEILQMMMLDPILCILDEPDSGLDIDAIKVIYKTLNSLRNKTRAFIIITHYTQILEYITPDYVHIFHNGRIIQSGDITLINQIESKGYEWLYE